MPQARRESQKTKKPTTTTSKQTNKQKTQTNRKGLLGLKSVRIAALYFLGWLFFLNFIYLFIYFWLCWVFGSCEGFLQLRQVGATLHRGAGTALHRGARAFHYRGPSRCGAQAPDAQAQQLWLTGPAAPWHVGSSQTRARTRVSCISRQILNHCATREAPYIILIQLYFKAI